MYDIIGDVHGYVEPLKQLLTKLGYAPNPQGVWAHPSRSVIFVGDLIDRGPGHVELIELVRGMQEAGSARVIMGNHELNAIAYASPHPDKLGSYLRAHSKGRVKQHTEYLEQVGEGSALHQEHIAWFKTLPLWFEEEGLEREGLRIVHACWHTESMARLAPLLTSDHRLSESTLHDPYYGGIFTKGTQPFQDLERVLKGVEIKLPKGVSFSTEGIERHEARVRWWLRDPQTWEDVVVLDPKDATPLHGAVLSDADRSKLYYDDLPTPVFFGHYWMQGEPHVCAPNAVCVDWSIGKKRPQGSRLAAYRWTKGEALSDDHFVWVERKTTPKTT